MVLTCDAIYEHSKPHHFAIVLDHVAPSWRIVESMLVDGVNKQARVVGQLAGEHERLVVDFYIHWVQKVNNTVPDRVRRL